MHADELDIDAALVRRFPAAQLPRWTELPIRELPVGGTDNAIFRLGDELSVRLLRRRGYEAGSLDTEFVLLPFVATALPLSIPTPIAIGAPGDGYPLEWAIHDWLPGDDAASAPLDLPGATVDLAELVRALWRLSPAGGPAAAGRGGPLAPRDEDTRAGIATLAGSIDGEAAIAVWEDAFSAPSWDGLPMWIHGDLDRRNLRVENGRITGVLDWASICVGDTACDVKLAWTVLDGQTRGAFRELLQIDDATWARGRGWALSQAVIAIPYYLHAYPVIVREASRWLDEVLAIR